MTLAETKVALTPSQIPAWTAWAHFPKQVIESSLVRVAWNTSIDIERFRRAFEFLVGSDASLRLIFGEENGEAWQSVLDSDVLGDTLEVRDFSAEKTPDATANCWLDEIQQRPFDLAQQNFSAALAKVDATNFLFQVNSHHAASDNTTKALLISHLDRVYQQLGAGEEPNVHAPSFIEYIENVPQQWRPARIVGTEGARVMPTLAHRPISLQTPKEVVRRTQHLGMNRADLIRRLANASGPRNAGPVLNVFLAVTMVLLSRLSGENLVAIGTMSHGRFEKESRQIMGQFSRVVPVTVELDADWSAEQLIEAVKEAREASFRASRDGEEIVAPSITTTVNFIPQSLPDFAGATSRKVFGPVAPSNIGNDLNIRIETPDVPGDYKLVTRLSEEVNAALNGLDIFELWQRVLDELGSGRKVGEISLGTEVEVREAKNVAALAHAKPSPEHMTPVSAFLAQVKARPDAVAVRDDTTMLSYAQLEQLSRRIAGGLMARGVRSGDLVATQLPRSANLIAAILGILRTGAGYYTIDQELSAQRITETLHEVNAPLLIHPHGTAPQGAGKTPTVDIETLIRSGEQTLIEDLPEIDPFKPMYVVFTSGSTGTPKGIVVPHKSFMRYQHWARSLLTDGSGEPVDWGYATSLAFDSANRVFISLDTGGTIHCYEAPKNLTGMSFVKALEDDKSDGISLTPSQLRLVVSKKWKTKRLRMLISVGEPLPVELAEKVLAAFPGVALFNFYGASETTMAVTAHKFDPTQDREATVPIGRPPDDAVVHVVDSALRPVPPGIPGELLVGGQRLSLGYLNRPDLTRKSFLDDPFYPNGKAYRTGDLGFLDENGNLIHLGRNDKQVKINGLRVEIGEVETAVSRHPNVEDCAVIAIKSHEDEPVKLVAFYTSSTEIEPVELRQFAGRVLSRALLPKAYFRLGKIPHTLSGKTDRRALQAIVPEGALPGIAGIGEAPRGEAESTLARVWCDILGLEAVSRDDDFYELGGDSLSFLNMVLVIERDLGIKVTLDKLGASTVLSDIARCISNEDVSLAGANSKRRRFRSSKLREFRKAAKHILREASPSTRLMDSDTSFEEVSRRVMLTANDWPGDQLGRTLPVSGQNLSGDLPALIWCFNGGNEARVLGERLAPRRPLYALRSMNSIVATNGSQQTHQESLAQAYADEVMRLLPDRPYLIGGNCQAGRIATAVAREITRRNGNVARLCLLDHVPSEPLPLAVSLFFGRDSVRHNPFFKSATPQTEWESLFTEVTWDIVSGRHGQYFRPGRIEELSTILESRLSPP